MAGENHFLPPFSVRAQFFSVEVSLLKSPPTTTMCWPPFSFLSSRTATELAPVVSLPCRTGISIFLSRMNNLERRPPLTKQASSLSNFLTLVPLDAKHASPGSADGNLSKGIFCQSLPPLKVRAIKNLPLIGSPSTMPLFIFQKSMASKNIPFVESVKTVFHVLPPSIVFKI